MDKRPSNPRNSSPLRAALDPFPDQRCRGVVEVMTPAELGEHYATGERAGQVVAEGIQELLKRFVVG